MLEIGDRCVLVLHGKGVERSEHEGVIEADLGTAWKVNVAGATIDVPKEWARPAPSDPSVTPRRQ